MTKRIRAWHFLQADRKLRYGDDRKVKVGKTYSCDGVVRMCESGMHASRRAIDALGYAPGAIVCLVECWGGVEEGSDKLVCQHRKVLAMADVTRELHLFACDEAERALVMAGNADARSINAIRIKRLWVDGGATDEELAAARGAWVAAWPAAWVAAWVAAWPAAWVAARDAAWYAAKEAAKEAAMDAANDRLEAVLLKALGVEK